ncbi:protein of unknown function [Microbacterium sp. LKL04]|uniref:HNH endonuclease n=1 Tax=Microbacterium sp. LKL04 TaxID=912630 RepID=UPI000875B0B9|nr:HNH endonuclease signature motif containing protein [Microbacterium sp. LKL04]SCY16080.1 protein of unknown function [Microbacterium sp. LKL04]
MTEVMESPDDEAYLAAAAGIVADVEDIGVEFARVKIRELRALAAVGRLADAQGAPRNARVQVHDMVLRSISAEVAGVMRMTDRPVQRRIGEARTIIEVFPASVAAWEAGRIVQGHVKAIVDAGLNLPGEMWAQFEAIAIERCDRQTPNRVRGEIDHTHGHALGGKTALSNLAHLCQRHHSMNQFTAWRVRQVQGGVLDWTSPLGRTYREDAPTPAVAFMPAPAQPGDPAPS